MTIFIQIEMSLWPYVGLIEWFLLFSFNLTVGHVKIMSVL